MDRILTIIKAAVAAIGGTVVYFLGGLDNLLIALLVVIVLDSITGIIKAIVTKTLSSEVGRTGIGNKILSLIVVALAFVIGELIGDAIPLREITIMFFIANEGISILENAALMGLPIPEKLKSVLIQIKDDNDHE